MEARLIAGFVVVGVVADVDRVTIARFTASWRPHYPAPPAEDDALVEPVIPIEPIFILAV